MPRIAGTSVNEVLEYSHTHIISRKNHRALINVVGEHQATTRHSAQRSADYVMLIEAIRESGLQDVMLSIKPTSIGLDQSYDAFYANLQ